MSYKSGQYTEEQMRQIASSMGLGGSQSSIQPAQSPSIQIAPQIEADPRNVVFNQSNGVVNRSGARAVGQDENQLAVERAVATKQALIPLELQAQAAEKKQELDLARQSLQKGLKTFIAYDNMIPRGEGFLGRHLEALDSFLQGQNQQGKRGVAVKMHNDMVEALKTPMAKILGNMGNLAVPEQTAAKQLFTKLSDTDEVKEAKQAFMIQIATGIENEDPALVKQVLKNFMGSKFYDKELDNANNDVDLDELLPPVDLESFKL
jgi:hypothetical protein